MKTKRTLILIGSLLLTFAIVGYAGVLVVYNISGSVQPVEAPWVFWEGTNANQPDLSGETIQVSLSNKNTSATITVHPTYADTYYIDVLRIKDNGTDTIPYYAKLKVETPIDDPNIVEAKLYLVDYDGTSYNYVTLSSSGTALDLKTTSESNEFTLQDGHEYIVVLKFKVSPSATGTVSYSFTVQLLYSPESGMPPSYVTP